MHALIAILFAYLLGCIPFGYLLVRLTTGKDVRASGSGNIGATNVLRTTGRTVAVLTLLLDIGKGSLAVWHGGFATHEDPANQVATFTGSLGPRRNPIVGPAPCRSTMRKGGPEGPPFFTSARRR